MQENFEQDSLAFQLHFMHLHWDKSMNWTKISTKQLIKNITQKDNEINSLTVLIIRLMFKHTNLHELINSKDDDVSQLGIQLLFKDYLDLYNELDVTGNRRYLLHDFPKGCVYRKDSWYKDYCYEG